MKILTNKKLLITTVMIFITALFLLYQSLTSFGLLGLSVVSFQDIFWQLSVLSIIVCKVSGLLVVLEFIMFVMVLWSSLRRRKQTEHNKDFLDLYEHDSLKICIFNLVFAITSIF